MQFFDWYPESSVGTEEIVKRSYAWSFSIHDLTTINATHKFALLIYRKRYASTQLSMSQPCSVYLVTPIALNPNLPTRADQ